VNRGTRGYVATLAVLLCGGVLCLVASGLIWGEATATGRAVTAVTVTGGDVLPVAPATGLLALTAVVAVHATRRWGRRLVGGALVVAGAATAGWAAVTAGVLADQVARHAGSGYDAATGQPAGPLLLAAGGLLVAGAGLAVALRGPGWPGMGARYERAARDPAAVRSPADRSASDRPAAAWDALDRGEDPTD
jgi:uncharacterized membrane protein (TIGR02234 family)